MSVYSLNFYDEFEEVTNTRYYSTKEKAEQKLEELDKEIMKAIFVSDWKKYLKSDFFSITLTDELYELKGINYYYDDDEEKEIISVRKRDIGNRFSVNKDSLKIIKEKMKDIEELKININAKDYHLEDFHLSHELLEMLFNPPKNIEDVWKEAKKLISSKLYIKEIELDKPVNYKEISRI